MIAAACLSATLVVLIAASFRKLTISPEFRAVVAGWPLVAPRFRRFVAVAIPATELGVAALSVAALLGWPALMPVALLLTAAVFATFAVVQVLISRRAPQATCGCFGVTRAIGISSVARAASLSGIAVLGLVAVV